MGIRRLGKVLTKYDALCVHDNIKSYKKNKTLILGIDFMLYAFKYHISLGCIYIGFINQILYFLSNNIIPVYIIDGCAPIEKQEIINRRHNKREKYNREMNNVKIQINNLENNENKEELEKKLKKLEKISKKITSKDINNMIEIFKIFNINFIRASGEADNIMAYLFKTNKINSCLSEDTDLIVYGCKSMIKFSNKNIIEYNLDVILNKLNLKYEEFVELCIFLGCDYLSTAIKEKPEIIYNKYIESKNNFFKSNDISEEYITKFKKIKNNFMNLKDFDITLNLKKKYISYSKLYNYLKNYCNKYKNSNLKSIIESINNNIE